jgi:glucosyl-3-phosphoglycerate phosphatase
MRCIMTAKPLLPVLYLARHAETVFNRGGRLQGQHIHAPLTHKGIAQAHAMGEALRAHLGPKPHVQLWASTAGRAQQSIAIVAEHLDLDFFDIRLDARLQEMDIGAWAGRTYADVTAQVGAIIDEARGLFTAKAPGGEWYDDMARRLQSWLTDIASAQTPQLVIAHGISARVLRGLILGGTLVDGTAVADDLPQGTLVRIEGGAETPVILGAGQS